nr:uncharacterized protein LOC113703286 [Coffea arabica]XP_027080397.1 uncharacterized protein LOC113703286 [Coffea arabica]
MERLRTKREWMRKNNDEICPKIIKKKLEKGKDDARANIARWFDDDKFEVTHMHGGTFVVDLKRQTCTCRRWELTGIPCSHASCCILLTKNKPKKFVHPCYIRDVYLMAYEQAIGPINGPNNWKKPNKTPLSAPKKLKLPGRPKKARRRELDEPRTDSKGCIRLSRKGNMQMTCTNCKQKGHTKRKCPKIIGAENAKCKGRGPAFNINRCKKCKILGHNVRTCPLADQKTQDNANKATANYELRDTSRPSQNKTMETSNSYVHDHITRMAEEIEVQATAPEASS